MRYSVAAILALVVVGVSCWAVHPEEWGYKSGDYAYAPDPAQWFYLNALDTQWVVDVQTGTWDTFDNMSGWMYFNWPYAYSSETGHWHWFNVSDVQWVCNMSSFAWSIWGYAPAPDGMSSIPHGTNAGTDPDFGSYSLSSGVLYADKQEVSKELWDEVATWGGQNGYDLHTYDASGKAASHPAILMHWYDAVKWCNARSEMEELDPAYYTTAAKTTVYRSGDVDLTDGCVDAEGGFRLPTVEEWEYCARGGVVGKRFPWGADTINHCCANYKADVDYDYDESYPAGYHPTYNTGAPNTAPVTEFTAGMNNFGLLNMSGNVFEWCWDMTMVDHRVIKGGSWDNDSTNCRIGDSGHRDPSSGTQVLGFRTVMKAKP